MYTASLIDFVTFLFYDFINAILKSDERMKATVNENSVYQRMRWHLKKDGYKMKKASDGRYLLIQGDTVVGHFADLEKKARELNVLKPYEEMK